MKVKSYVFTEDEVFTIREALIEYWQMIKNLKPLSPGAIQNQENCKALKDQFIEDAGKM